MTASVPSSPRARVFGLESLAAFALCLVASIAATWTLLKANSYSDDAFVHQYWMWHFRDPALFTDPLTTQLRESARYPDGYVGIFWLATQVVNPIVFGEWLGVLLMAFSGWLIFLITRDHTSWKPAAWLAAAIFLSLVDIHRFHGGFPRAFVHPAVLLTVLLAMRRHNLAAAIVAAGSALFYPSAAVLAGGVLVLSALRWENRRPGIDTRRALFGVAALAVAAAIELVPGMLSGVSQHVLTEAEARRYPEFSANGPLHFFQPSIIQYLRQNRSGFDLRTSGSILCLAAIAILLLPGNLKRLRAEVLAMPVAALGAWGVAQLVLFRLYLPHRFTYPLLAFFAIAVAVNLRPTWEMLRGRRILAFALLGGLIAVVALALYVWPLGPTSPLTTDDAIIGGVAVVAAALVAFLVKKPALGAVIMGLALVAAILGSQERFARGGTCATGPTVKFLAKTPKDTIIAGDPIDLKCLVATAKRPVVTSIQLAPSYEKEAFLDGRERLFTMLEAYFGPDPEAIREIHDRYGAKLLWVRRGEIAREQASPNGIRWRNRQVPYGRKVRELLASGEPASLNLPSQCLRFKEGESEVYDLDCVVARLP